MKSGVCDLTRLLIWSYEILKFFKIQGKVTQKLNELHHTRLSVKTCLSVKYKWKKNQIPSPSYFISWFILCIQYFSNTYCLNSCRPCFHISWLFCCGWISVSFPSSEKDYFITFFSFSYLLKDAHPLEKVNVICLKMIRNCLITKFKVQIMKGEKKKCTQHIIVVLYTQRFPGTIYSMRASSTSANS